MLHEYKATYHSLRCISLNQDISNIFLTHINCTVFQQLSFSLPHYW